MKANIYEALKILSVITLLTVVWFAIPYLAKNAPHVEEQKQEPEKVVVIGGKVSVDGQTIITEFVDSATGTVLIAEVKIDLVNKNISIDFDPLAQVSFLTNEKNKERKNQIASSNAKK